MSVSYQEIAIDTAPFVDHLTKTQFGAKFKEKIVESKGVKRLYISGNTASEIFYILCRQLGNSIAKQKIDILLECVEVIEGREIQILAGKYKCVRSISLSDCFTLAVAEKLDIPALFRKERELVNEIKKKKFEIEIVFIEDL